MGAGPFLAHAFQKSVLAAAAALSAVPGRGTHIGVVRLDRVVRIGIGTCLLTAILALALVLVGD